MGVEGATVFLSELPHPHDEILTLCIDCTYVYALYVYSICAWYMEGVILLSHPRINFCPLGRLYGPTKKMKGQMEAITVALSTKIKSQLSEEGLFKGIMQGEMDCFLF